MKMTNITNMKMTRTKRTKRAKLLFFIGKYTTFRRICHCLRSGCSSSHNKSQTTSKCGKNKKVGHEPLGECVPDVFTTF